MEQNHLSNFGKGAMSETILYSLEEIGSAVKEVMLFKEIVGNRQCTMYEDTACLQ